LRVLLGILAWLLLRQSSFVGQRFFSYTVRSLLRVLDMPYICGSPFSQMTLLSFLPVLQLTLFLFSPVWQRQKSFFRVGYFDIRQGGLLPLLLLTWLCFLPVWQRQKSFFRVEYFDNLCILLLSFLPVWLCFLPVLVFLCIYLMALFLSSPL
jgi:hypothetical protein